MDNFILLKRSQELEKLSKGLGFANTYFLEDDLIMVSGGKPSEILRQSQRPKGKILLFRARAEETLRFVLEKTPINILYGLEGVHTKDSVYFVRSGLDSVLCAIAAEHGKTIGFSFSDILNSADKAQLLSRMRQNIRLCRKYKVKMLFSAFARTKEEMRSVADLEVLWEVLGGKGQ